MGDELRDNRTIPATDNLNRLLADAVNRAAENGDIETLRDDLRYCANELMKAVVAVEQEFMVAV